MSGEVRPVHLWFVTHDLYELTETLGWELGRHRETWETSAAPTMSTPPAPSARSSADERR